MVVVCFFCFVFFAVHVSRFSHFFVCLQYVWSARDLRTASFDMYKAEMMVSAKTIVITSAARMKYALLIY